MPALLLPSPSQSTGTFAQRSQTTPNGDLFTTEPQAEMDHSNNFGGGLDFEEDTNDIPEGLRMMAEQQQQQQARLSAHSELAPPPAPRPLQFAPPLPFSQFPVSVGLAASSSSVLPLAATSNVLPPLTSIVDAAPVKRPRGRPRKIPGTESRPTAVPGSRGRPRGSRARGRGRGRGRGGKRPRPSSDEDEASDGSDDMDDAQERRVLDPNEEMPDDWSPSDEIVLPPTTKYGRKISKPTPFAPTTRPTIHRKKRASVINPDASLMCQVCKEGHSPKANRLVICESCSKGWHQICHDPPINEQVVSSDLSWLCKECDIALARTRPAIDVGVGEWVMGEDGKGTAYSDEEKREWLEGLPLHSLIGFILSVEQKYAPNVQLPGLAIWPQNLASVLIDARTRKAAEAEERKIKDEAEENARIAESEGVATPSSNAEEPVFARTVASEHLKRAAASASTSAPPSTLPSVLAPVPMELDPRRPPPQQQQQQQQHQQAPQRSQLPASLQQPQPPYQSSYQPSYQQHQHQQQQQQQQRQYGQQPPQMPQATNRVRSPASPPPHRNALPPFLARNFVPSPVLQNQPLQQQSSFGHHPLQSLAPQFDFAAGGFSNDFFAAPNPHQYFQSNMPAYPQWESSQHNNGGGADAGRTAGAGGAGGGGSGGVAR